MRVRSASHYATGAAPVIDDIGNFGQYSNLHAKRLWLGWTGTVRKKQTSGVVPAPGERGRKKTTYPLVYTNNVCGGGGGGGVLRRKSHEVFASSSPS